MNAKDILTLEAACESFSNTFADTSARLYRLETPEKNLLAQKILLLPETDRSLVFFRYYFGFSPAATGEILDLSNPKERMDCCAELLAVTLGLHGGVIDDASMKSAARRAMVNYLFDNKQIDTAQPHRYSAALRRRLDEITTIPRRGGVVLLFAKRIAIAALAAAIMFTTALAASPALRKLVFDWAVNTFPQYSQIGAADVSQEPTEGDFEILKQYYPTYVPERYELYEVVEMFPWTTYDYRNAGGDMLFFEGSLQDESQTYYNSEGAVIETLTYMGQPAFYWKHGDSTFFIWQQDGFQFNIIGKIAKEEALKMADSTKLQK